MICSEGIDTGDAGLGDMPNIAGCKSELMLQGGRHELAVLDRHRRIECHNPPPLVGAILIEWENARPVMQHEGRQPCFEADSIFRTFCPLFSTPFLISPSVITLKNKSVDETDLSHAITFTFGLVFASSETTFVSRRKLKPRCVGAGAATV